MKASKPRTCHICGATGLTGECENCKAAFATRKDAKSMTKDERLAELASLFGPLEYDFSLVRQRIEELVGRPVFSREMAKPDSLMLEIRHSDN